MMIWTCSLPGPNYQEISEDVHYDYCRDDLHLPPPLPPRQHQHKTQDTFSQTFPRRRKNLFHHLGVGIEPALSKNNQEIFVIQSKSSPGQQQIFKKDLEKFLGVPISRKYSNKKDLSSYLGVNRRELERIVKRNHSVKVRDLSCQDSECEGSLSTSTDSSSLWSSF